MVRGPRRWLSDSWVLNEWLALPGLTAQEGLLDGLDGGAGSNRGRYPDNWPGRGSPSKATKASAALDAWGMR